jgi:hypothetical protein
MPINGMSPLVYEHRIPSRRLVESLFDLSHALRGAPEVVSGPIVRLVLATPVLVPVVIEHVSKVPA